MQLPGPPPVVAFPARLGRLGAWMRRRLLLRVRKSERFGKWLPPIRYASFFVDMAIESVRLGRNEGIGHGIGAWATHFHVVGVVRAIFCCHRSAQLKPNAKMALARTRARAKTRCEFSTVVRRNKNDFLKPWRFCGWLRLFRSPRSARRCGAQIML
jgi:hypothetical protein